APARRRRPEDPRRLHPHRGPAAHRGDPRAGGAPQGLPRRPPVRDRLRRRRRGDPLHADPAHEGRRPRRRVAGDLRARGVLQRDEAHAQRAAGRTRGPQPRAVGHVAPVQRDELARAHRRLGHVHRPRPAARRDVLARPREGAPVGVALPHRRLDAEPGHDRPAPAVHPRVPAVALPRPELRARGHAGHGQHRPAGDRPARAEEHGAVARGRVVRLPAVRHRRRPAAHVPGVALRPVEGPARRHRRVPDRQGEAPHGPARARRLDGVRRPRGLGLLQRDDRSRRRRPGHPHPQQLQQRRLDRGQRVPVARRCRDPEVDARGLRPDGVRGDLEGPPVHRRQRRRHPAAGAQRHLGLPRRQRRGVRRALGGHPAGPSARQGARAPRQGARPRELPHAALPARLPEDLHGRPGLAPGGRAARGM
ncbi:MAG: Alpha,alpha-trehalose synthase, partial [uncultured Solirubrobacteraceae bacterium]